MRARLIYNKINGTVSIENVDRECSVWQEIESDTSEELVITIEVEGDSSEGHENLEEVIDGD